MKPTEETALPCDNPARLRALYPALAHLPEAFVWTGSAGLIGPLEVPANHMLFDESSVCQGFPLVLAGEVRVSRHSGEGRQLELYRVLPGELCLMSSASLFNSQPLAGSGISTCPTRLMMIPPPLFQQWLDVPTFRSEVLGLFAQRMADLTSLVDAIAFQRLDQRLAAVLLGHGPSLAITHQALADQLGTVREIVTRLLRRFEREAWVELSREHIRIIDSAALRDMARSG